jgi:hypothetical protein
MLGAVIGLERQWRQRMAGLRTNALVSLGAAGFVVFSATVSGDNSPTRVAAQIVSGIGFLGAGVMLREGVNIRGPQYGGDALVLGDGRDVCRGRSICRKPGCRGIRRWY